MKLVLLLYFISSPVLLYFSLTQNFPYSYVWIIGTILLLLLILNKVSHANFRESYTYKTFENKWIQNRNKEKGLKYRDKTGCYVIFIYRFPKLLPGNIGYKNVYVGQSLEVYKRVHNHLNRKGNGDVYADVRDGKSIYIDIYPCTPKKLNELEKKLIRKYKAEKYYNRTSGGATKRGFF